MTYVNVKMRTGEDLVAQVIDQSKDYVEVKRPLHIMVHPHHGFFVKSFNIFAESDFVTIRTDDILWCKPANEKAIEYYEQFLDEIDRNGDHTQTVEEFNNEIEDTLEALLDSRYVTKH